MKRIFVSLLLCVLTATAVFAGGQQEETTSTAAPAAAKSEEKVIQFWFAFTDDKRSNWIKDLAAEWSDAHPGYKVVAESKGSYRETLQAAALASRQGVAPHLVHVLKLEVSWLRIQEFSSPSAMSEPSIPAITFSPFLTTTL